MNSSQGGQTDGVDCQTRANVGLPGNTANVVFSINNPGLAGESRATLAGQTKHSSLNVNQCQFSASNVGGCIQVTATATCANGTWTMSNCTCR